MVKEPLSEEMLAKIFKTNSQNPEKLIKREDKNHEFKESYSNGNMASYLKTMASFANNDGGYIVFGITDSPRLLKGLDEKAYKQFDELSVEKLTQLLNEHFAPSIEWTNCIYQFRGKYYGIIYVYSSKNKPVICKKARDAQNSKYTLKESDIYYRYSGRSERIKYPELHHIIEEKRKAEERQWLHFMMKAAKIGVENASLLDLSRGEIQEGGNKIILDEDLLQKVRFIKEGHFVERYGAPTLRLIGEFQTIGTGKVVYQGTRKVIRAIEQTDIIESFLKDELVENPADYIKRICSSTTGNLPVFYYMNIVNMTQEDAVKIVEETTVRGTAKKTILRRLQAFKPIATKQFPEKETETVKTRKAYYKGWIQESIGLMDNVDELKQCLAALLYVNPELVRDHIAFIKEKLLELYKHFYESLDSTTAGVLREALCYVDSATYFSGQQDKEVKS